MRKKYLLLLSTLFVLLLVLFGPTALKAQGKRYGRDLKEAGEEYGEAIKEGFSPDDGKERAPAQKVGHAGKEFGKGTGNFFKDFGKSTGRFFKGIFVKD